MGGGRVRIGLYARVSTERQQERGTVGSQVDALRAAARADGYEVIEEFVDDGYSGARLDAPRLIACVTPRRQACSTGCCACASIVWLALTPTRC